MLITVMLAPVSKQAACAASYPLHSACKRDALPLRITLLATEIKPDPLVCPFHKATESLGGSPPRCQYLGRGSLRPNEAIQFEANTSAAQTAEAEANPYCRHGFVLEITCFMRPNGSCPLDRLPSTSAIAEVLAPWRRGKGV
jgi:hypothetical protein